MILFLKKVLIIFYFVLVYLFSVFLFNYYHENNPKIPNANILFIGDSHIKNQINPDSFFNSYNYGNSGDIILGIKWKLKKMLNDKNIIDTVIISLGYHNFREKYPSFFNTDIHQTASVNIRRYLFINDWYFLRKQDINKTLVFMNFLRKIKKPNIETMYLGHYKEQIGQMNDSSKSSIDRLYYRNKKFNPEIIQHINEIIELCNSKKVRCFFIFPPTHCTYTRKVPTEIRNQTDSFMSVFSKSPYFMQVSLKLHDSLFFDGDHLNRFGAQIYTRNLKQIIYKPK